MEEYNPEVYKEHIGVRPTNDKLDGVKYVHGVIEWKVFKVNVFQHYLVFILVLRQTNAKIK